MTWFKKILGLDKNFDAVAHTKLGELGMELGRLNTNLSHFKLLMNNIERAKKEGRTPKVAIRENFISTLRIVRKETFHALKLEEEVRGAERAQQREEKQSFTRKVIQLNDVLNKLDRDKRYVISADSDSDLIIPHFFGTITLCPEWVANPAYPLCDGINIVWRAKYGEHKVLLEDDGRIRPLLKNSGNRILIKSFKLDLQDSREQPIATIIFQFSEENANERSERVRRIKEEWHAKDKENSKNYQERVEREKEVLELIKNTKRILTYKFNINKLIRRKGNQMFSIGSSSDCDLRIPAIGGMAVQLKKLEDGNIEIYPNSEVFYQDRQFTVKDYEKWNMHTGFVKLVKPKIHQRFFDMSGRRFTLFFTAESKVIAKVNIV